MHQNICFGLKAACSGKTVYRYPLNPPCGQFNLAESIWLSRFWISFVAFVAFELWRLQHLSRSHQIAIFEKNSQFWPTFWASWVLTWISLCLSACIQRSQRRIYFLCATTVVLYKKWPGRLQDLTTQNWTFGLADCLPKKWLIHSIPRFNLLNIPATVRSQMHWSVVTHRPQEDAFLNQHIPQPLNGVIQPAGRPNFILPLHSTMPAAVTRASECEI